MNKGRKGQRAFAGSRGKSCLVVVAGLVLACEATGQESEPDAAAAPKWAFDLSALTIDPPHDGAYVATVLRADREELHLEGRWNYEDRHTGSLFAGWNFDWQGQWHEDLGFLVVPMAGVVAGDTDGIAPGLEVDVTWGMFELWSESEYVFDLDDSDDNYFYCWNELTAEPFEWLRIGLVAQRTRTYDQELSIDRGLLLGSALGPVSATVYWFNPDDGSESYVTFSLAFAF